MGRDWAGWRNPADRGRARLCGGAGRRRSPRRADLFCEPHSSALLLYTVVARQPGKKKSGARSPNLDRLPHVRVVYQRPSRLRGAVWRARRRAAAMLAACARVRCACCSWLLLTHN